ncbi:hypothetical protein [Neobacillus soli]|uniref:hypothetical protein n=1 Tax=Neobacillus soli TaxID=220688 RepID=UPI001F245931|nr:hypothetical protein [Neobacillus soli]
MKTFVYYLATTGIAIIIGLAVAFAISPEKGWLFQQPMSAVKAFVRMNPFTFFK